MPSRNFSYQKLQAAARRAGPGASIDSIAAFAAAPTLAGELAGTCSASLLRDIAGRISDIEKGGASLSPLPSDPIALKQMEQIYKRSAPVGAVFGIIIGAGAFSLYDFPSGFIVGIFFPGVFFAFVFSALFQNVVLSWTKTGRRALRIAYGVHLRTQASANHWYSLSWREFETEVANLFRRVGYAVNVTARGGDEGVDMIATTDRMKLLIQCKKYGKPVGPSFIRELIGTLVLQRGKTGVLISSSGFSNAALKAAQGAPLLLLDINDLLQIQKRGSIDDYFNV